MIKVNRRMTGLYQAVENEPYELVLITHVDIDAGLAKVHVIDRDTSKTHEHALVVDWDKVHEVA